MIATLMLQYHPLIARSKVLLDSSRSLVREIWSWFYKLSLFNTVINGQNITIPNTGRNQTRPLAQRACMAFLDHIIILARMFPEKKSRVHEVLNEVYL